jgi:perosamine synthetase
MIPVAKPYLTTEEAQAAYDTIMSGWVTQGPRVRELEENFVAYTGAKYAVAVSNCTCIASCDDCCRNWSRR